MITDQFLGFLCGVRSRSPMLNHSLVFVVPTKTCSRFHWRLHTCSKPFASGRLGSVCNLLLLCIFCEVHFFDGWLERHHQEEVTLSMSLLLLNWMKSNSRKTFKRFLQFLQSKSHSQVLIPFITGFVRIPGAIFNAAQGRTGFLGCKMTREFEMLNY